MKLPHPVQRWWHERHVNERVVLAGLAISCLALWGFVELAEDAPAGNYLPLETRILRAFRDPADLSVGIGPPWLPEIARDITALGSVAVLTSIVVLVLTWLVFRRKFGPALFLTIATGGGALLATAIKSWIARPRPTAVPHLMVETSLSFPSAHSMLSSVVYFTLAVILGSMVDRTRERIFFVLTAMTLSFVIGLSRVYLGVHYPSDVLAGWTAGLTWALWCATVAWWLRRRGWKPIAGDA